jgi:hypothetical protein
MLCFCGCGEHTTEQCYNCENWMAEECHLEGTCNAQQLHDAIDRLVEIRETRQLTADERATVASLQEQARSDWHLAVLMCLATFV